MVASCSVKEWSSGDWLTAPTPGPGEINNVIDLADQAMFLGEQATGATGLLQRAWVYNRGLDFDGLRRFHRHLQQGRLSRSIERSRLPFGRHCWVSPRRSSGLEIAPIRPREEFDAWLIEQAGSPVKAEQGPAYHLAVLPFTDGGSVRHDLVPTLREFSLTATTGWPGPEPLDGAAYTAAILAG